MHSYKKIIIVFITILMLSSCYIYYCVGLNFKNIVIADYITYISKNDIGDIRCIDVIIDRNSKKDAIEIVFRNVDEVLELIELVDVTNKYFLEHPNSRLSKAEVILTLYDSSNHYINYQCTTRHNSNKNGVIRSLWINTDISTMNYNLKCISSYAEGLTTIEYLLIGNDFVLDDISVFEKLISIQIVEFEYASDKQKKAIEEITQKYDWIVLKY